MRLRSASRATLGLLAGLAAGILTAQSSTRRTPAPRPPAPQRPSLSAEDKAQALKVLAAAVEKRTAAQGKPAPTTPFQAHRCAVLHDPRIFGKERAANGPFRTTCSDWVTRRSRELAVKDAASPCDQAQFGQSLAGCTSWVDHWDAGSGKWTSVWKQSSP